MGKDTESTGDLDLRLKQSTADLLDLERALISGDTDSRVLRDFRDAVDYIRKAAWAVQEWKSRQSKSQDTSTVLPLLMFERVRRATQLCKTIATDVEHHAAMGESSGVVELSEAIECLRARLASLQGTARLPKG